MPQFANAMNGIPTAEQEALQTPRLSLPNIMNAPSNMMERQIGPLFRVALGVRGGDLMSQTLAPILAGYMTPEMGAFSKGVSEIAPIVEEAPFRAAMSRETTPQIRRGTGLLNPESAAIQHHGSMRPLEKINEGYGTSSQRNMYGPGFYTTDTKSIAEGYADVGQRLGLSKEPGVVYNTHETRPMKFFDVENQKMPESYLDKIERQRPIEMKDLRSFGQIMARGDIVEKLGAIEHLRKEGYDGITHTGGKITGSDPHRVKVYWKPEELRLRPELESGAWPPAPGKAAKRLKELNIPQSAQEMRELALYNAIKEGKRIPTAREIETMKERYDLRGELMDAYFMNKPLGHSHLVNQRYKK